MGRVDMGRVEMGRVNMGRVDMGKRLRVDCHPFIAIRTYKIL